MGLNWRQKHQRALAVSVTCILLAGFVIVFVLSRKTPKKVSDSAAHNELEWYAVYSAYLSDVIANDHRYADGTIQLVLMEGPATLPPQCIYTCPELDRFLRHSPLQTDTRRNFIRAGQSKFVLQPFFHLPGIDYVIAQDFKEKEHAIADTSMPRLPKTFFSFSQVGFSDDHSQALFAITKQQYLCVGGGYVLMQRQNNAWKALADRTMLTCR